MDMDKPLGWWSSECWPVKGHAFGFEVRGQVWSMFYAVDTGFNLWPAWSKDEALVKLVEMYKCREERHASWLTLEGHPTDEELRAATADKPESSKRGVTDLGVRAFLARYCHPVLLLEDQWGQPW